MSKFTVNQWKYAMMKVMVERQGEFITKERLQALAEHLLLNMKPDQLKEAEEKGGKLVPRR